MEINKKEKSYTIKSNFVTNLFQFSVKAIKMLQKTNIPTEYDNYNEKQRRNFNNIMINFLLFVAKQQTDPSFREMFARLAFYLYVFLENTTPLQSGGVRILRGNQIMDVNINELQPGDLEQQYIVDGMQLGQQVAAYANPIYNQAQNGLVLQQQQYQQHLMMQPPQQMIMARNEQFMNEMAELQQQEMLEDMRGRVEIKKLKRQVIKGEVPTSQYTLNAAYASSAGCCCTIFMQASTKITYNGFQNVANLLIDAASGAGEALYNVKEAVTPDFVKAGVSGAYNLGKKTDAYFASWFTSVSPNATDAANSTMSDLLNGNTNIGTPDAVQEGFFQQLWDSMKDTAQQIDPGSINDTSHQCGLCCCMAVYTTLTYNTILRAKNAQLKLIEGSALNSELNAEANARNQNIARITAGVGAGVLMATGVGAPAAMTLLGTANAIINNPINVDNQTYPQVPQQQIPAGPQPILIGGPPPQQVQQIENADPTAIVGLRQRNPDQNAGYQKFKKTKKTKRNKRNNRKTKKIKRNNRKSRKTNKK
jgi:hypothetical protein